MKTILVSTYHDHETGRQMLEATCDSLKLTVPAPIGGTLSTLERAWYCAELWLEVHGTDRDRACTWAEGWTLDAQGIGHYTFTRTDGRQFTFGLRPI